MKNKIFHTADENVVFIEKQRRMEDIMDKHITTPITEEVTKDLKSGDYVYITGTIYVARDAAHKRMIDALQRGEELPINIKDSTIYYMGPSPPRSSSLTGRVKLVCTLPSFMVSPYGFRRVRSSVVSKSILWVLYSPLLILLPPCLS